MNEDWNWAPTPGPAAPDAAKRPVGPGVHRWRKTAALVGVAGAVSLAGGSIAYAATSTPSPSPSTGSSQSPSAGTETPGAGGSAGQGRMGMRGGHERGGMFGMFGPGIHGESVVKDAQGNYVTVATQVGSVTAVSSSSITVKSEDGYSRTYAVTAATLVDAARDGIATVKTGHTVRVVGTVKSGDATAVAINDRTLHQDAMEQWRPKRDRQDGTQPGSGNATPQAPSSGSGATPSSYELQDA